MKNRSAVAVWLLLAACAALILGAMGWLTHSVMEAEHERSLADSRADLEERIRLSLWRMDTTAAGLTIEENQRLTAVGANLPKNPLVRLRFKVLPGGVTSPVEAGKEEEIKELNRLIDGEAELGGRFQMMCTMVNEGVGQWSANALVAGNTKNAEGERQSAGYQQGLSMKERAVRAKSVNAAVGKVGLAQQVTVPNWGKPLAASIGAFQPAWLGGEPFLLREVRNGGPLVTVEGVWLDSAAFRKLLLDEAADLLPCAALFAADPAMSAGEALVLASFPWRLDPGEIAVAAEELRSPVVSSLVVGWVAVVVALVAGMVLVQGVMRMSERRASFVSAVTHELRTPLTTFRLYSDMLDSGAVTDEEKRSRYFRTLRREADRLSHLVENVLAFSRIERRGGKQSVAVLEAESVLDGMRERFEERLATAGMKLEMKVDSKTKFLGDAAAIEHVLFNLIDNSAKYAAGGEPPQVEISACKAGGHVEIGVKDFGPGVPESECRQVFRAFHKSAQEAAESRPGVGLGLALSRRLARAMGGELECRSGTGGACFILRLPQA